MTVSNNVPVSSDYSFPLFPIIFTAPSSEDMKIIETKLGQKICKKYEKGKVETPKKKWDAVLICATVMTSIFLPPVGLILGLFSLLHYFSSDYDNPRERKAIVSRLAKSSFETINTHSVENIIGYKLLDKVKHLEDSPFRIFFYAQFARLANEFTQLKDWKNQEESKVENKWSKETKLLHSDSNQPPSRAVMAKMKPWDTWKTQELEKIKRVYKDKTAIFETNFQTLKKWLANPTNELSLSSLPRLEERISFFKFLFSPKKWLPFS